MLPAVYQRVREHLQLLGRLKSVPRKALVHERRRHAVACMQRERAQAKGPDFAYRLLDKVASLPLVSGPGPPYRLVPQRLGRCTSKRRSSSEHMPSWGI